MRPGRNVGVPTLAALIDGEEAEISALAPADLTAGVIVELVAAVPAAGAYTVQVGQWQHLTGTAVVLHDRLTHTRYDLATRPTVLFRTPGAATLAGRFALEINLGRVLSTGLDVAPRALAVWPNPATAAGGSVQVTGCLRGASVAVFDLTGRRVASAQADATGTAPLVTRGLAAGAYVVRAADGRTTRLVVE